MRCTALRLWQLVLLLMVMYAAAQQRTIAAYTTDRRQRKLHATETEEFAEPEMLIFGSRTTADDTQQQQYEQQQQQRVSTAHAMPAPFAKPASRRQPVEVTPEHYNENKLQRTQMFNDMNMNDRSVTDINSSSDEDSLALHQQRQRARIAAARSRTPTQQRQRQSLSNKRNRNDANNSNAVDVDTPQSRQTYNNYSDADSAVVSANRASSKRNKPPTATASSTTTTTTTREPYTNIFENFQRHNPFNFFAAQFWNPTTVKPPTGQRPRSNATKRPPKKYQHATPTHTTNTSNKEAKLLAIQKPKTTTTTTATAAAAAATTSSHIAAADGPFRITLPTLSLLGDATDAAKPTVAATNTVTAANSRNAKEKDKRAIVAALRERYVCPRESEVRFQLFPKICNTDKDCTVWQRDELCCDIFGAKSCVTGKPKPLEESSHAPILGVIPRKCPTRPLAELWWEVKECDTDMDCWPRICCPDGRRRYCRTSQPELEAAPVPVKRSFNYLTEYLECTPPPPPIFDLHPRACTSTLDCFPNVCCQEAGLRHCRPPKKSVLTLMANFLNVDFVKRLTQNIVIK